MVLLEGDVGHRAGGVIDFDQAVGVVVIVRFGLGGRAQPSPSLPQAWGRDGCRQREARGVDRQGAGGDEADNPLHASSIFDDQGSFPWTFSGEVVDQRPLNCLC